MNSRRWKSLGIGLLVWAASAAAQEVVFTRPGPIMVMEVTGQVVSIGTGTEKNLKVDDRLRAEVGIKTGRRSTVTLEFGNGTLMKVGSEAEVNVPEFWQHPHSQAGKMVDWKEEPSPSRTRLALARGDVTLTVKPLKAARGSTFTLELNAGTLRITDGVLRARVQNTDVGLGLCTIELQSGSAEFERIGGAAAPLPLGRAVVLAVETDRRTGAVTVTDAPKPDGASRE